MGQDKEGEGQVKILLIIRIHYQASFERLVAPLVGRVFWDLCLPQVPEQHALFQAAYTLPESDDSAMALELPCHM